jgi:hypothetical protein
MNNKEITLKNSKDAIDKFISLNRDRHIATVSASTDKKYNKVNGQFYVSAVKKGGNTSVIVEGDSSFTKDYKSEYTVQNAISSFLGQTLIIETEDIGGAPAHIEITTPLF